MLQSEPERSCRFFFSLDALICVSVLSSIGARFARNRNYALAYYNGKAPHVQGEILWNSGSAAEIGANYASKKAEQCFSAPPVPTIQEDPRSGRVGLVITCTFTARWVASNALYHFQLPAADSSREACEPRADPASRITKCGLKKDLSQTPQGTYSPYHIPARDARGNQRTRREIFVWSVRTLRPRRTGTP